MGWLLIKGLGLVMDVVPSTEAVKTGLDYSMHGMLAHNVDSDAMDASMNGSFYAKPRDKSPRSAKVQLFEEP